MHPECEPMRNLACGMALGMIDLEAAYLLQDLSAWELEEALLEGWCDAVDIILSDHQLTDEEYESLTEFEKCFDIPVAVDSLHMPRFNRQRLRWGAAFALNQLDKGMYPGDEGLKLGGLRIPFNFQRSEKLVWMMQDVDYYEQRTRVERRGHYSGAGFRVTDDVYLHGGGFNSRPVEFYDNDHLDTGVFALTTNHIYFSGDRKKFRINYDRLVSYEPYDEGVCVMRDAMTANPQTFITGDGWLLYNLIDALASRR